MILSMDLVTTRSLIQFIFVSHCVKKTNPLFMTEKLRNSKTAVIHHPCHPTKTTKTSLRFLLHNGKKGWICSWNPKSKRSHVGSYYCWSCLIKIHDGTPVLKLSQKLFSFLTNFEHNNCQSTSQLLCKKLTDIDVVNFFEDWTKMKILKS